MTGAFRLTLEVPAVVALISAAIIVAHRWRSVRRRRITVLGAGPRRSLLAFVAGNGEQGSEDLIAIPEDAWQAALPTALGLLGKLRGEAHAALVSVFLHRGAARAALADLHARSSVKRARAAQLLGDLAIGPAVPDLCRLLTDRDPDVRVVAVRALGRIGEPSAAWRIIASLDRPGPVPSLLATDALVQLGREAEVVLSAALDHPQARVRAVCLDALGLLGATGAVHRMAKVLREDTVPDVRAAAAVNLGRLGSRTAVKPLTEALDPARPPALRAAAARALGDLGTPSAVPALTGLLDDGEFQVAHEAAHGLRRLGPAGLDALRDTRDAAVEAARPGQELPAAVGHCQEALAAAAIHEIGLAVAR
jgi:HEAT repeat protein